MKRTVEKEPLVKIDYLTVVNPVSLKEAKIIQGDALLTGAIKIGKVRLIDNIKVSLPS